MNFIFSKQFEQRFGCYASIEFEIVELPGDQYAMTFDYRAEPEWKNACEAGVAIFCDYYRRVSCRSLHIRINRIGWLSVDTSLLIVLYATVEGLCQHFSLQVDGLGYNDETATFCFPERRVSVVRMIDQPS